MGTSRDARKGGDHHAGRFADPPSGGLGTPKYDSVAISRQRYLERARTLKHDTSDYDNFYRRYRNGAKPKTRIHLQNGKSVEAYGPFGCTLSIGPTPVKTTVYVTADRRFAHEFLLGREDWPGMTLKTMHPPRDAPLSEAHIRCRGPGELMLTTLVDTGAGPNVLSMEAFLRMGYSPKDLKPNQYTLSMAG